MSEEIKKTNKQNISTEDVASIAAQAAAQAVSSTFSDLAGNANTAALKINEKIKEKQIQQQQFATKIAEDMKYHRNCCIINIPATFKKYQPNFTAQVNGCTVTISADGRPHEVHNVFAVIILRRMQRLDQKIAHMSDPDISEYTRD